MLRPRGAVNFAISRASAAFVLVPLLALAGCKQDAAPGAPSGSAAPVAAAGAGKTGGVLDIALDKEKTTMRIGPAYARPHSHGDGFLYYIMAFNEGATGTSCATKLDDTKPVGGTDWAVAIDQSTMSEEFLPAEKNKEYDDISVKGDIVAKVCPIPE
jgi:hypothetical protein